MAIFVTWQYCHVHLFKQSVALDPNFWYQLSCLLEEHVKKFFCSFSAFLNFLSSLLHLKLKSSAMNNMRVRNVRICLSGYSTRIGLETFCIQTKYWWWC